MKIRTGSSAKSCIFDEEIDTATFILQNIEWDHAKMYVFLEPESAQHLLDKIKKQVPGEIDTESD